MIMFSRRIIDAAHLQVSNFCPFYGLENDSIQGEILSRIDMRVSSTGRRNESWIILIFVWMILILPWIEICEWGGSHNRHPRRSVELSG